MSYPDLRFNKYTINPYTGCQHACTYCYARFMKRFTAHKEPWGQFVDVKINAPDLLRKEVKRKPAGRARLFQAVSECQTTDKDGRH